MLHAAMTGLITRRGAFIFALSLLFVLCMFAWEHDLGLSLADEGYLWYGVQRVLLGDVPLRDFMAYEPGRYYWSAAWMTLRGNQGIVGVRMAIAAFQFLGLWAGLHVIAKAMPENRRGSGLLLIGSALTLRAWMVPRHKLFDISLCLFLLAGLAGLIERPVRGRYIAMGAMVGLVAGFGRNHGLYGAVASIGAIAWLNVGRETGIGIVRGLLFWGMGFAIGMLPLLAMVACIPGFARAMVDSVALLLAQGSTNLPLPVPWPWTASWDPAQGLTALSHVLIGSYFLALPMFCVLSMGWCIRQRWAGQRMPPGFVASALLSAPYAHFAFSRADASHLAQGIFPLLVGTGIIVSRLSPRWSGMVMAALFATGLVATLPLHPGWQLRDAAGLAIVVSYGDTIKVDGTTAAEVTRFRELVATYASDGGTFVTVPFYPGVYALAGRRAPMWELYPLFPRSIVFQEQEVDRMRAARPRFVFVVDVPLDGRAELTFSRTHPVEFDYFLGEFKRSLPFGGSAYLFLPVARAGAPGTH